MATTKTEGLIDSIRVPFGYEHYVRLRAIDAHDFDPVVRKVQQDHRELARGFAEKAVTYLKRYYALLVLDPLNPATMSRPVDDFWHVHALHSHQYMAFCDQVFGEYLHHVPLLFDDDLAVAYVGEMYGRTRERQVEVFGSVDEAIVPSRLEIGVCCTPTDIANPTLRRQALWPLQEPALFVREAGAVKRGQPRGPRSGRVVTDANA